METVSLSKIEPPQGPIVEEKWIAESVERYGIVVPLVVIERPNGKLAVVDGRKRYWTAVKRMRSVPVTLAKNLTAFDRALMTISHLARHGRDWRELAKKMAETYFNHHVSTPALCAVTGLKEPEVQTLLVNGIRMVTNPYDPLHENEPPVRWLDLSPIGIRLFGFEKPLPEKLDVPYAICFEGTEQEYDLLHEAGMAGAMWHSDPDVPKGIIENSKGALKALLVYEFPLAGEALRRGQRFGAVFGHLDLYRWDTFVCIGIRGWDGTSLPVEVVGWTLGRMAPEGARVLVLGRIEPVTVAMAGYTPVWFEPDRERYEAKLNALKRWYESQHSGVEFSFGSL